MRQDFDKAWKIKAKIIEKARLTVTASLKKDIFRFAFIFAFAIAMFIIGRTIIETPHPHYFGGGVTEFASRVLLLSVAFLLFVALAEIKKIAEALCSLAAYEISGGARAFRAQIFKKSIMVLRPFFYLFVGLLAFVLFQDVFRWIHPELNAVIGVAIAFWVVIASYLSFVMLTKRAKIANKWPLMLIDDLVEVVIHVSSPDVLSREVDFAYAKTAEEAKKVRKIFEWKYGNLAALLLVLLAAYFIATSGVLSLIAARIGELQYFGAFLAGLLFTSAITFPFAILGLLALVAAGTNTYLLALIGGAGAMVGDYFLFCAFRRSIDSTKKLAAKYNIRFPQVNSKLLKIIAPIFAGFIIMSPLPDEIGIAILGAVHFNPKYFLLLAYVCNTVGIFAIASISTVI